MSKRKKPSKLTPKEAAASAAGIALLVGFLIAYLISEATLNARPHPIHWAAAGAATFVVWAVTYGVTYWRHSR